MSATTDPDSEPLRVPLSDQLGLEPERAAFETWKRKQGGHYMSRNNAPGSDLSGYQDAHTQGQWEAWQAAVAAERERWQRDQQVWEDTRTQRDELLAHLAGKAPLPQWAADWLKA